jgi:hypothetical protein
MESAENWRKSPEIGENNDHGRKYLIDETNQKSILFTVADVLVNDLRADDHKVVHFPDSNLGQAKFHK